MQNNNINNQIVINTEGYKLHYWQFNDLVAFLKATVSLPINHEVFYKLASNGVKPDFYYFKTFKEAWNNCYFGWDKEFENFKDAIKHVETQTILDISKKDTYAVYGFRPNVPRCLNNNPRNMLTTKSDNKFKRTVVINCNTAYSWYESKQAIFNRGVCIINLIKQLEINNNVVLNLFECVEKDDEMIYTTINLKKENERINLKQVYFPLVNPDFLRRLIFRIIECTFDIEKSWFDGYGSPYIPTERDKDYLNNSIYISTPEKMNITGRNLKNDYQNFLNYITSQDYYKKNIEHEDKKDFTRKRTRN